jgi:hypothetical protein
MANPKEIAAKFMTLAIEMKIRFPKTWDEAQIRKCVGATLLLNRGDEPGTFNEKGVLNDLEEKFGVDEAEIAKQTKKNPKKRTSESGEGHDDDEDDTKTSKKPKKTETVAVEDNRGIAEAIKEMADIYFKNKDARKGGVFSKAAKAIREADFAITTAKQAMSLAGVGKGIASYAEEFLTTGVIAKLEELRAGTA